jgi:hypothetical protein
MVGPLEGFFARHAIVPFWVSTIIVRMAEIGIGVVTTRICEFPALRLRDRLFPRRVDTPVGAPAIKEALEPVSAHL